MQTPEQIARDIIVREYGEIEITRTNVLVDGARLVELIAAGIKAADDLRPLPIVIVRDGMGFDNGDAEVVDLDFIDSWPDAHSDFDQGDIDDMLKKLRRAGWNEAANDVQEWWGR